MLNIVKISGKTGSGKTELLSAIAAGSVGRNYLMVDGTSTASGIIQALRGRSDVVLCIDECSQSLLDDLEAAMEDQTWRISRVYAVMPEDPLLVKDAERMRAIDAMRICLTPEYESGYSAVVFGDQAIAISEHFGLTAAEAVDEAVEAAALPVERELTEEAQDDRDDFNAMYDDGNCSCHISQPCGSCTHPGNPDNQADDDDCWVKVAP